MTPENQKFVKECAVLAKHVSTLYENDSGLVSIDPTFGIPSVHLMEDRFLNFFGDSFEVVDRKGSQFPWRLVHTENGVIFFCITERNPKVRASGQLDRMEVS